MKRKYALEEIQYAVDIATGDDGHMANKVTDILESFYDWVWCKKNVCRATRERKNNFTSC